MRVNLRVSLYISKGTNYVVGTIVRYLAKILRSNDPTPDPSRDG